MDAARILIPTAEPAAPVRWEPCPAPRGDDAVGLCTACGWPVEDHAAEPPFTPARAA